MEHNNFLYSIGGSKGLNLNVQTSDVDLLVGVFNNKTNYGNLDGFNIIEYPIEKRFEQILTDNTEYYQHGYQILFSTHQNGSGDLFNFIMENKENIFNANLKKFYDTIFYKYNQLKDNSKAWYIVKSKAVMYFIFFLNILEKYPEEQDINSLFYPENEFKNKLIDIRKNLVSYDEIQDIMNTKLINIEKNKNFYLNAKINYPLIDKCFSIIEKEKENEYLNYQQIKELNILPNPEKLKEVYN